MGTDADFPVTLWDLLPTAIEVRVPAVDASADPAPPTSAQDRYDQLVLHMKQVHSVRIVRWRKSMTGCAWVVDYEDDTAVNLIESPYPRGPVSCAIFLHEIGHHAIGFYRYKPRCYEEYMAWQWAIETMEQEGFNVTDRVRGRVRDSVQWSVDVALQRGLKNLPKELTGYAPAAGASPTPPSQKDREGFLDRSAQKQFDSCVD
jgi:hypothetical protein